MMETVTTSVKCKNCSTEIELKYCPACGQPKKYARITPAEVWKDFLHAVFGLESGWLFTAYCLILYPGQTVRNYLLGKRKPYVKPLQFHLLMLTAYFLINSLLEVDIIEMSNSMWKDMGVNNSTPPTKNMEKLQALISLFTTNFKVITTLFVPLTSLVLLVFYRKASYYFAELLVFSLYVYGGTYLFYMFQTISYKFQLVLFCTSIFFMCLYFFLLYT
jgi:hypothetical protein